MENNLEGNGSEAGAGLGSVQGGNETGAGGGQGSPAKTTRPYRKRPKAGAGGDATPGIEGGTPGIDGGAETGTADTPGGGRSPGARKPRRGKKAAQKGVFLAPETQVQVAAFFRNLNNELAEGAALPELSVTADQAASVVAAVDRVGAYYLPSVSVSEGTACLIGLATTLAVVYGPGAVAIIRRKSKERKALQDKEASAPLVPVGPVYPPGVRANDAQD